MAKSEETKRRSFPAFPFDPYPIQIQFMDALYSSLDRGGVSMLESPTGTGKTLSIICSTLQWILDNRNQFLKQKNHPGSGGGDGEPDWMRDFVAEPKEKRIVAKERRRLKVPGRSERRQWDSVTGGGGGDEDDEFLLEEYESGEDGASCGDKRSGGGEGGWSSSDDEVVDEVEEVVPKVFFCSRTHSQLSQLVKEFKRTKFASGIKLVCLASRKNMCINQDVLKLRNTNRINEKCLELQKSKNQKDPKIKVHSFGERKRVCKATSGCPMLQKQSYQEHLKDEIWQKAMDIEDLVHLGTKLGTCPYYCSRSMVPSAELVVLPYQSLLFKPSRESLGLNLKNSVVIIDEAHNLADSITNMYNTKITLPQLKQIHSHLERYLDKFRNRLGAGNRRYIQTLIVITNSFMVLLGGQDVDPSIVDQNGMEVSEEKSNVILSMTINEFLFALDIDNINLVKLQQYIKESNIMHKVSSYGGKYANCNESLAHADSENHKLDDTAISEFQALVAILHSLTNNDPDGRMIVSKQISTSSQLAEEAYIKFVMLSADKIFSEIINEVHAVVLAGGTLQPIEEARMRLFPSISSSHIHFFSCNHIVPPESILPIVVCRGPSGMAFDFSYSSRTSSWMIEELGRLLCNIVTLVPEGIVVFFSSFEYERKVYDAWKASGILERILKRKHIFREPKCSTDIENVLKEYKEAIVSSSGAVLLAVVGGKVSEGINFSDGMARCIIVVGLPYPSPSDVELMERIKHIERLGDQLAPAPTLDKPLSDTISANNSVRAGFDVLRNCKQGGREYYENLCMKSVNQSIGRAIRHRNDYASILLVDSRYASSSSRPTDKLPVWIKDRLVVVNNKYGEVHRLLHQFFQSKKHR